MIEVYLVNILSVGSCMVKINFNSGQSDIYHKIFIGVIK